MTNSNFTGTGRDQLRSFIERIERLEDEKKAIAADISEVKSEAKSNGFDVRAINDLVRLRRVEASDRAEREAILDTYKHAMGMLPEETLPEKPATGGGA